MSTPDETRSIPKGSFDFVHLDSLTIARGVAEPGWSWSEHVKPIVGGTSCQVHHVGYLLSGRLHVRLDDGTEAEIGPGDAYVIPPGHDGWVVGDEPAITLEFEGATNFARPDRESS